MTNILNDANLVEHWNLDEASGTRNGATGSYDLTDNNTVGQDANGVVDQAAAFVAANTEYLSSGDAAIANYVQANYTLSIWFKFGAGSLGFVWYSRLADSFIVRNGSGTSISANGMPLLVDSAAADDTWYHVVIAVAENGENWDYRMTINGSTVVNLENNATGSGAAWTEFSLGAGNGANGVTGSIDHVSFFDRALSLSEMGELYNGGSPPEYVAPASGVPGGMTRTMYTTMSRSMVVSMGNSGD